MAYQRFNQNDMSFIADTKEDLKTLPPCGMGSTCYIIAEASKYMVNSKGEWICQTSISNSNKPNQPDEPTVEPGLSEEEIAAKYVSKEQLELEKLKNIQYEVLGLPKNSLIDYRQKEIRVLIPEDAEFKNQNVGENGNPNMWYFQFKAYAPEGAEYFKEDDLEDIEDQTMYTFTNNSFAGIDEYGRKYSTGWLAGAVKNGENWTYFGKNSSEEHMVGFFYSVEWYDENQSLIGMDKIRINLTNKECHSMIEPYYMYDLKTAWGELEE